MLGVFQQVAINIDKDRSGELATFDLMFEGIRTALKAQIQRSILNAEKHLENDFAVRVLKALFLVKYKKEFKATVRNICVLMLDGFDRDLPALRKQVEEALNLLELQIYIQRNGELYEFLTDEEKDVEQEIKNTDVESTDVADELAKIVFDQIIKNRKIRYDENNQDYPFSKKLDDKLVGREYELAIHIITSFHEHAGDVNTLKMQSLGRRELLVVLPPDDRLMRGLVLFKRTDKYIRQNITITQQDSIKRILTGKTDQNRERLKEIIQLVKKLMGKAALFVSGEETDIGGEDPQTRIFRGFHELIQRTYTNLRMLRGIPYAEKDIAVHLQAPPTMIETMGEAEQEMLAFIQAKNSAGTRITLKNLIENFEGNSYGWYLAAILCILAKLCARERVEVRSDANILEGADLERALRNSHGYANVILNPMTVVPQSQLRNLKEFYENFFDAPPKSGEAKPLGKETAAAFQELLLTLEPLAAQTSQYPFLAVLNEPIRTLKEYVGKPSTFYLTDLLQQEDVLHEMKKAMLDPVRNFMSGTHKTIYADAQNFVDDQEPNFSYVEEDEAERIRSILSDSACYKGNKMQQVKSLVDSLKQKIIEQVGREKDKAKATMQSLQENMTALHEYSLLSPDQQEELLREFTVSDNMIRTNNLIALIRDQIRRFEEHDYPKLLGKVNNLAKRLGKDGSDDEDETEHVVYVSRKSIQVACDKAYLADEKDVNEYLEALKEAMMNEIKQGKRIQT